MNISRETVLAQKKPFIAYAYNSTVPGSLVVTSHVSERAADAAALKHSKSQEMGYRHWGWFAITDMERKYGASV